MAVAVPLLAACGTPEPAVDSGRQLGRGAAQPGRPAQMTGWFGTHLA